MYIDAADSEKVGRARQKSLGKILPATSMIQVSAFISPEIFE